MANWSELQVDVIRLILRKLVFSDYIRLSYVCKTWRCVAKAAKDEYLFASSRCSWLMLSGDHYSDPPTTAEFLNLADLRKYKIDIPPPVIRHRWLMASANGWVLTVDDRADLILLNPLTGAQNMLPQIATLPFIDPVIDEGGDEIIGYRFRDFTSEEEEHTFEDTRCLIFSKAFLLPLSAHATDFIVLLEIDTFPNTHDRFWIARPSDDCWTRFPLANPISDSICYNNQIYTLDFYGEVTIWNLDDNLVAQIYNVLPANLVAASAFDYIAVSPFGELMQISRIIDDSEQEDHGATVSMKLHRFDTRENSWFEIDDIGGNVIFVGGNQSVCLSSENVSGSESNCVYFSDADSPAMLCTLNDDYRRDVGIYRLRDESIQFILSTQDRQTWPPPIWITPFSETFA